MVYSQPDQGATIRNKKPALVIAFLLVCTILSGAYVVSSTQYEMRQQNIFEEQDQLLQSRTLDIVRSIDLWLGEMQAQAARISNSDLYSLFAFEVQQLEKDMIILLSNTELAPSDVSEDIGMLVAQIPLLRGALFDYMNHSGLQDARLINKEGLTVLSALLNPAPCNASLQFAAQKAIATNAISFAPMRVTNDGLVLDFADPIIPMHASDKASEPDVALVLAVPVTDIIAKFLANKQGYDENIQVQFVQWNEDTWEAVQYDAILPFSFNLKLDLGGESTLPFQKLVSLDGKQSVYVFGMRVEKTDWWILTQVPVAFVNAKLNTAAWTVYGIGILLSTGFILLLALLWWIIVGREQRMIANRLRELYLIIKQQKHLLDCVNVSLDVGLFMMDQQGMLKLCNKAFANIVHRDELTLLDMAFIQLFDEDNAAKFLQVMEQVEETEKTGNIELALCFGEDVRLLRITLFPFVDCQTDTENNGVVGIMQDITEFRRQSQQHRLQQQNTIKALVQAIEGVDPYLAGHSQLMEKIAELIVDKLNLDEKDRNTIRIAAGLSQVGKLFVPRELLTKSHGLTDEEHATMMQIPEHAYQILKNIDFALPVAEAVYAMYEKMDGSGYPRSLEGDDIVIHARVLAVVNAFCAMTSPRSYRSGMSMKDAIVVLCKDTCACDQTIVAALEDALSTPEGMELLQLRGRGVLDKKA